MTSGPSPAFSVTLVFDGGSRGNPGQGYGSFMLQSPTLWPDGAPVHRLCFSNHHTNNEAEYDTLLAALQTLLAELQARGLAAKSVRLTIRGDSQLVIRQVRGEWNVRAATLWPRWQQVQALLAHFGQVQLVHQPRAQSVAQLGH